jgi:hypothetical protein
MAGENNVWFSLFKGNVPSPVKIFEKRDWKFESGVSLNACIIGKSHRICFESGSDSLTEFIAYPIDGFSFEPVEKKLLKIGDSFDQEFVHGSLFYRANIQVIKEVYKEFDDFLKTLSSLDSFNTVVQKFKNPVSDSDEEPFTGIVVVLEDNLLFTVHTYPEEGYSVVSSVKASVLERELLS